MRPRVTDWGLAFAVAAVFGSGLWTLTSGRPEERIVFIVHDGIGIALGVLTLIKLWRVRWRLVPRNGRWPSSYRDARTLVGIGTTLLVLLTLLLGICWVHGGAFVMWGYNLLNWHIVAAFVLVATVSAHMIARALPLRRPDVVNRRQALRLGAVFVGGILAAPAQLLAQGLLQLPGATRRFTGSRELASFAGNAFPTVSWVADAPRPLDRNGWQLAIRGAVERPFTLQYADIEGGDSLVATLDCTGGFYSTQRWRGALVGPLLDRAGLAPDAAYVRFLSVTGYRWSLPLDVARNALIATQLGDETLSHGHGAPARLVAPGERGFVWVKWLVALEVLTEPDLGQLVAINASGFSGVGHGE